MSECIRCDPFDVKGITPSSANVTNVLVCVHALSLPPSSRVRFFVRSWFSFSFSSRLRARFLRSAVSRSLVSFCSFVRSLVSFVRSSSPLVRFVLVGYLLGIYTNQEIPSLS